MIVDETQEKLAVWAQDPDHRFFDIYHLVYDEDWLYRAFLSVKSNSGSGTAGVDEETVEDFGENLQKNLKDLRKSLKSESYTPSPVRQTYIPKGDGRKRPLGIPTIRDRIVQEALRMILEPIYETDFSGSSYGFRPNRSTHDALTSVYQRLTPASPSYMPWVIDADIEGFFDNVDHRTLEQIIQDRIEDQKIRDLVWKFLKAGYVEDGETHQTILGTPQGGIISPLLANVYLNELDQWVKQWTDTSNNEKEKRRKRGKGNWQYVRYADDFLLMTNGKKGRAEWMMEKVGSFVSEELNLMISDKKSELRHAEDGLSFLGYELKAKTDTGGVKRKVPIEAIRDIKSKIRAGTEGAHEVSARRKIDRLNSVLKGWANYYKYATNAGRVFSDVENYSWHRVTKWLARKWKCFRKRLINQHLRSHSPITTGDVTLAQLRGFSDTWDRSPNRFRHPYLDGKMIHREKLPPENPSLANQERRPGWSDARWKAIKRDNFTCRNCGRNLEKVTIHVHHISSYAGHDNHEEANKADNLVSLCRPCHQQIEKSREYAN